MTGNITGSHFPFELIYPETKSNSRTISFGFDVEMLNLSGTLLNWFLV